MTSHHSDRSTLCLIPAGKLAEYGPGESLSSIAVALLRQQKQTWPLLTKGYAGLEDVQTRSFEFDGFVVKVQFNPGRITSSSAEVDEASLRRRKCFLCQANLPEEQRGVVVERDFVLLCNPFPIFPEHFTIPHCTHQPQRIDGSFLQLLTLAKSMGDRYTLFYNGPRCGASAPDHLHFQAGLKGFMPIDAEYPDVIHRHGSVVRESAGIRTIAVEGYLRRFVALESDSVELLESECARVMNRLKLLSQSDEEPMVNVLVSFEHGWRVVVFPRRKHRPSFFHADEETRMVISPAAVDLGGVCITPREQDFRRVRREDLVEMFEEVTLGRESFERLVEGLR
jgi:hypothetical protein